MWVINWGYFYEAYSAFCEDEPLPRKADDEFTMKFETFDKAEEYLCKHYGEDSFAIIEHIK